LTSAFSKPFSILVDIVGLWHGLWTAGRQSIGELTALLNRHSLCHNIYD